MRKRRGVIAILILVCLATVVRYSRPQQTELDGKLIRRISHGINPHGDETTEFEIMGNVYPNIIGQNLRYIVSPSSNRLIFVSEPRDARPRTIWCIDLKSGNRVGIPCEYYIGGDIGSTNPLEYDRLVFESGDKMVIESKAGDYTWTFDLDLKNKTISQLTETKAE